MSSIFHFVLPDNVSSFSSSSLVTSNVLATGMFGNIPTISSVPIKSLSHTTAAGVKKSGGFSPEKRSLVRALRVRLCSLPHHTRLMVRVWDRCDLPQKRRRYEYERKLRVMEGNQPKSRCLEIMFVWDK